MISKNTLKEIIVSNEEFILKHVKKIIECEGVLGKVNRLSQAVGKIK